MVGERGREGERNTDRHTDTLKDREGRVGSESLTERAKQRSGDEQIEKEKEWEVRVTLGQVRPIWETIFKILVIEVIFVAMITSCVTKFFCLLGWFLNVLVNN